MLCACLRSLFFFLWITVWNPSVGLLDKIAPRSHLFYFSEWTVDWSLKTVFGPGVWYYLAPTVVLRIGWVVRLLSVLRRLYEPIRGRDALSLRYFACDLRCDWSIKRNINIRSYAFRIGLSSTWNNYSCVFYTKKKQNYHVESLYRFLFHKENCFFIFCQLFDQSTLLFI